MKKIFMLFGALVILLNVATAQDCPFRVKFEVIPASCYNNGKVAYALTDGSGNVLTSMPAGLSEVRAYYIEEGDTAKRYSGLYLTDSIMAAHGGWDTLIVDYGTYTVGLEAICTQSSSSSSGYEQVKKDTSTVLTVPTTYVKPSASALYVTSTTVNGYGKRPTLDCSATGRVQLKIENGRFPYTVAVVRHGTNDTLRTEIFADTMYHGLNETRYDYHLYYTVDNLPGGDWDFYVTDGCDYGLPRTGQNVEVVHFPVLDHVEVFASSGNMMDSNIVKINAVLDNNYEYLTELAHIYSQYRFVYDGTTPSSDWKPMPPGNKVLLRDTVTSANKYCDLWNRDITLEYRRIGYCGDTLVSRTFQLKPLDGSYFEMDSTDVIDSMKLVDGSCDDKWYFHRLYYEIFNTKENLNTSSSGNDGAVYRHHYTHPLTWVYRDTERNMVIKRDTVTSLKTHSYLYADDVKNAYGPYYEYTKSNPLMLPVERQLVDAHGCLVYSRFDSLPFFYDLGEELVDWRIEKTDGDHCCTTIGSIRLYEHYHSHVDPDGTQIILERSPYNNRYNFTAVYSSATHSWTVSRDNLENVAIIQGGYDGRSLTFSDYCLPSGPYEFKVITPCHTFPFDKKYSFPAIYSTEMTDDPAYETSQQCTDRYITYTAGSYSHVSRNTDVNTGLPLAPVYTTLNTQLKVVNGPTGGYDNRTYNVGDHIRVSIPGQYVVRIAPNSTSQLCGDIDPFYDTINYDGATVEFDYAYAYLCDSTSTSGTAYVKGIEGTPPYHYTLYNEPDKTGTILGDTVIANPNDPAIFENIPMDSRHQFSCRIEDACGAYFHVNFYPLTLADLQKIWFDGGLTVSETCEGSSISVHALDIASILKYQWYNPDNQLIDSVSSPSIFIPRNAADGWYKVVIRNTSCQDSIVDSVRLTVKESPTISLTGNKTICPGEEANLSFTPTSPLGAGTPMEFSIAFVNGDGIETRNYTTTSGTTVTDTYITFSDAKIFPLSNSDGNCDYTWADEHDTIRITMKQEIADICTLMGSFDTVCYGSDAQFRAKSTMAPPYTIHWFADYEMTHPLKSETITDASTWSLYDTLALKHYAEVFVTVEKDGYCPIIFGFPTNAVNMTDGSTVIPCGKSYRLYDDGGADGNFSVGTNMRHTYTTADGKPVTIHFDELNLSETSHLFVISGPDLNADSVIYNLTAGSAIPDVFTSRGNSLTLFFMPGMKSAPGWSAVVEHSPTKSVADVWKTNEVVLRDEVCQSQTNTYDDPYGVVPGVVASNAILNTHIRKAGTYTYTHLFPNADIHGCDSSVTFVLTVNAPPRHDTTVVTTNLIVNETGGYTWPTNGVTYNKSGRYSKRSSQPDGCDSLDILDLIILQIDTTNDEICRDDTARLGISVTVPDLSFHDESTPPSIAIGDVLCQDGSIMKVDSFLAKDPTAQSAKGVVFYVDRSGMHGLAAALDMEQLQAWSSTSLRIYQLKSYFEAHNEHHESYYYYVDAVIYDTNGYENTGFIKHFADSLESFSSTAPAAHYCYYYNDLTRTIGTVHRGWYLPSVSELLRLHANQAEVGKTYKKLHENDATIDIIQNSQAIWSSTPGGMLGFWTISPGNREGIEDFLDDVTIYSHILRCHAESDYIYARPIIAF